MARREYTEIDAGGVPVRISSPAKEYFPPAGGHPAITKLDLVEFYLDARSRRSSPASTRARPS